MKMNLSPAATPETIVSAGKRLSIPIYQRLFVWADEQIDNLLQDLWNVKDSDAHYYLGVITVHENDSQQWEIVDGQQRLTFLTLLGCVMMQKGILRDKWGSFVVEDGKSEPRLFFHGRREDRKDILDFLNDNDKCMFGNRSFARFHECFNRFAVGKSKEDLEKFSLYCFKHAAFLVNELPAGYGPEELNLYFEKMNSTGRQLSPIEVVKGKFFSKFAARWNACMNFDKKWAASEGNESKEKQNQRTLQEVLQDGTDGSTDSEKDSGEEVKCRLVMRSEILALHVLKIMAREMAISLDRGKLIETFNCVFKDGKNLPDIFIENLENYRKWIDDNIIYLKENDGEYEYAFRDDPDNTDDSENIDSGDEERRRLWQERRRLRQFQSMLFVSSGEHQEWVLQMYLDLKGRKLTYDALRRADAKWHESDNLTREAMTYQQISRYWFWKLDYLLWDNMEFGNGELLKDLKDSREIVRKYVFRQNRSIEHLHPQSRGDEKWGVRDSPQARMHQFGNLAMISVSLNSAQSDDGIGTKFGRVKDWLSRKSLESIKMLLMFKLCGGDDEAKWTPTVADEHGEAMLKLLTDDREHWLNSYKDAKSESINLP